MDGVILATILLSPFISLVWRGGVPGYALHGTGYKVALCSCGFNNECLSNKYGHGVNISTEIFNEAPRFVQIKTQYVIYLKIMEHGSWTIPE